MPHPRRALVTFAIAAVTGTLLLTPAARAQGYDTYRGAWQGTLLFSTLGADGFQVNHHASSPVQLRIDDDGSVSGQLPAARCAIAGSAGDYRNSQHASLRLDLSACEDTRLDGHYEGRLLTSQALEHASLRVRSAGDVDHSPVEAAAILHR